MPLTRRGGRLGLTTYGDRTLGKRWAVSYVSTTTYPTDVPLGQITLHGRANRTMSSPILNIRLKRNGRERTITLSRRADK